jgi:thioredoxin 1
MRYGIRGIPALILFKDGQVVAQKVGAVSKGEIAAMLDAAL